LALYGHGLITSMEAFNYVWRASHDDIDARNRVCEELRAYDDDSICRLSDKIEEPGFQIPYPDG
jgi:hypothetical protein